MEAGAALSPLKSCSWAGCDKKTGGVSRISGGWAEERRIQPLRLRGARPSGAPAARARHAELSLSRCFKKSGVVESENGHAFVDEALILKRKSEDILPSLYGQCIYLVGMMGSGKTTVGKILSEVLGYSFFDREIIYHAHHCYSDKLVEQAVGISSVAQIFEEHNEAFFREHESEVLRDLSSMRRLVVATGGGAVIRPINWRYMKQGITVWLDVPLEALARRIAAVGTASRPLLHQEPGDPYTKALMRLSKLYQERGEAYANADARVSLHHIAAKQGHDDVSSLTPTAIAVEGLIKMESFLSEEAFIPPGVKN